MAVVVAAAGANQNHTTADIPERQILLRLRDDDDDPAGYEHHILLVKLDGSKWIALDSELRVDRYDLAVEPEIIPLARAAMFLIAGRPFQTVKSLTEAEIGQYRQQAMRLAEVLGHPGAGIAVVTTTASWIFSDPAHPLFGQPVPGGALQGGNFMAQGSIALVMAAPGQGLAPRWTVAERVADGDKALWLREKRPGNRKDQRLLGLHTEKGGALPSFRECYAETFAASQPSCLASRPSVEPGRYD